MNSKVMASAVSALGLCIAMPVAAQDVRGVYVELDAGVATVSDVNLTYFDDGGTFGGTGAEDSVEFHADLKSAFAAGGAIGYDFGMVRTDIRVDYSRNQVRSLAVRNVNGAAVTLTPADGADICDYLEADGCSVSGNAISFDGSRVRQLSALANIWADIPVGGVVTTYVGGGLGVGGYEVDGEGKARFAWQLGAGAAFNVSPNIALTANYRYRQINGSRIVDEDFPDAGVRIGKVKTSSFTAGVRFRF